MLLWERCTHQTAQKRLNCGLGVFVDVTSLIKVIMESGFMLVGKVIVWSHAADQYLGPYVWFTFTWLDL